MLQTQIQHLQIHLSGQDDNLGDSALRDGLLRALRGRGRHFDIYVGRQSSDYMTGLSLTENDTVHESREGWLASTPTGVKPIHVLNAGEINPPGRFPNGSRVRELTAVKSAGGAVVATGLGIKTPSTVSESTFDPTLRNADIMSWRDETSRDVAGFGDVAPDWAFSLGTPTTSWGSRDQRPMLAVTLRFDRPYPDQAWHDAVRAIADRTDTRIVTLAQVGRDAPRAVRLAAELGCEYLSPPSFSHAALDSHVRTIFSRSTAVISDRAHGLIIGATEGAVPVGSAADPQKLARLMSTVGLQDLTGSYGDLLSFGEQIDAQISLMAPSINAARERLQLLTGRIQSLLAALAP